ncbi:replication region DNA-binding N-term [Paraburkholderia phenazinium]|uniref:Replication region DNA-binding N-term n=1 Tax=Paraburkholderia phenazinium TaxID=60549 RepID=A0A1G8JZJ3_9BURK|nr:DNA-binding protein [Paraburkholderia phenazinium]SDI35980.1 replication region DNA-binding N-term [Paraburkholderia phenazinium]
MSDILSPDAALAAEIERLKAAFPKTRELYREVCALMFFRFGVTPTANRLYQLVRKGSMGTPTEVLAEFWATLREKSRVRIDRPDLPPDVQAAAGDLVAVLWGRSTAAAHAALAELRFELDAEKEAARTQVTAANEATARAEAALDERSATLAQAQQRISELEQALAVTDASRRTLDSDVARLQGEIHDRDVALAQARTDFAGELAKLREEAQRAEERLRAAEKRALMEIEHERALATRLQKDLGAAVRRAEQHDERHRAEAERLRSQLADARHQVGLLQGRLAAAEATSGASVEEIGSLRQQLSVMSRSAAAAVPRGRPLRRAASVKKPGAPVLGKRGSKGAKG